MWPFKSKKTVNVTNVPADCVFNSTMEALDVSTVADWKYDWHKYTDYLINKRLGLRIAIEKSHSKATIGDIYSKIFTDDQSRRLYNKAMLMSDAIEKRKNDEILRKDIVTLKRLFPKCFN